jgi:NTE family protein
MGVRPLAVSGASAGALVAGFLGAGLSATDTARLFVEFDLRRTLLDWGVPWRALGTMANRPGFTGVVRTDRALVHLRQHLGDRRIEDCIAPRIALSVTNLTTASTEIKTSGPLAELILASGAFPGLFAAREIDGAQYWDGGIANPLPFDPWLTDPEIGTILVHTVVNPIETAVRDQPRPLNVAGAFNLSHQIICDELLRWKTEAATRLGKRLLFLRTTAPRPGLRTARRLGPSCVAAGLATARESRGFLEALAG